LNTTLPITHKSEHIHITIPNTLERLFYIGNLEYLQSFPNSLKALEIVISDFALFYKMINKLINIEELIITLPDSNYPIHSLFNIIKSLTSLKLLIININYNEFINGIEHTLRKKLSSIPNIFNISNIDIYFRINDNLLYFRTKNMSFKCING
jgi:hypothetical protein